MELPQHQLFETPTVDGLLNCIAHIYGGREVLEEIARTMQELEQLSEDAVRLRLAESEPAWRESANRAE